MPFDLFEFYRYLLAVLVASYATARLITFIWRLGRVDAADPRSHVLLRRYLVVQLLRLRVGRFAWDLTVIAALLMVLVSLVLRHWR